MVCRIMHVFAMCSHLISDQIMAAERVDCGRDWTCDGDGKHAVQLRNMGRYRELCEYPIDTIIIYSTLRKIVVRVKEKGNRKGDQ